MDTASLKQQFDREATAAVSEADLRALKDRYLARKGGLLSTLLKDVASAPADRRPALGRDANQLKEHIETQLNERLAQASAKRPAGDAIDVTLPGRPPLVGHRHPLTLLRERVEAIFLRFGFLIAEGPELEDDYHNFEALNMPAEHPARDMQDTLYLKTAVRAADGRHADPLHGDAPAADPADRAGTCVSARRARPHALADVHAGRGARRRRRGDARRLEGHARRLRARAVRRRSRHAVPSELLPLHRAERRARHQLRGLWRDGSGSEG